MSQLPPAGAGLCMPEGRPRRRQTRGRASGQRDQGQGRQGSDHGHRLADVLVRCGILGHPTQEALRVRRDGARGRHRNPGRSSRRHRRGADQARLAGEEVGRLVHAADTKGAAAYTKGAVRACGPRDFVYHGCIAIRAVWRESFRRGPPKAQPPGNAQAHERQTLAISGERLARERQSTEGEQRFLSARSLRS